MDIGRKLLPIITYLFLSIFSGLYAQNGHIYGKIVDCYTGERLSNVSVSLMFEGNTVSRLRTKADGVYGFNITRTGNYRLNFSKPAYNNFSYPSFSVHTGDSIRKDVPMQKPPRFIGITEINDHTKEIDSLDIGAMIAPEFFYVDFFNSGSVNIDYVIGKMCEWLEITPASGTLQPNESNRITIKIDPDKFEAGKTTGKMLIITNDGNKVLNIRAVGKFPEIATLPFAEGDYFPSIFRVEIEFNGRHTFKKMGYCFSDINPVPTVNDEVVLAMAYDLSTFEYNDNFTYAVTGKHQFPWLGGTEIFEPEFACRTYYVRAFLKYENENNTVIYSNNVAQFTLWDILCP